MDGIDWGFLLFAFEGRINRAKFWLGIAIIYVVLLGLAALGVALDSSGFWVVYYIVAIAVIWPALAIYVKRWHDRGKSGWWCSSPSSPSSGRSGC